MKTEIIIAARGEIPTNLIRTVEQASRAAPVCVVFDGREALNEPPKELVGKVRIERPWVTPRGCGQARHYGITTSAADLIVICDGHMTFPAGWLDAICDHHKLNSKRLTCCRMQSLDQSGKPLIEPKTNAPAEIEGGGWICLKSREVLDQHFAVTVKWCGPPAIPGPVGCVIGACYALRKSWYTEIGEPLSILEAWGGDEEVLSLGTHFMGGKVVLLDIVVGHIYMAAHRGRNKTADESAAICGNRLAILNALPCTDAERAELIEWTRKTKRICNDVPNRVDDVMPLREVWAGGRVSWDALLRRKIVRDPTDAEQRLFLHGKTMKDDAKRAVIVPPAPKRIDAAPQVIVRREEECICGAKNSFVLLGGYRKFGDMYQAYGRCSKCGHKAHIRRA